MYNYFPPTSLTIFHLLTILLNFTCSTKEQLEPLADEAMTRLVTILVTTPETARNLVENSAITIGRLGFACPDKVAVHLDKFAAPWCNALADVKDTAEKDSAFRGMCIAIQTNPAGLTEVRDYSI